MVGLLGRMGAWAAVLGMGKLSSVVVAVRCDKKVRRNGSVGGVESSAGKQEEERREVS